MAFRGRASDWSTDNLHGLVFYCTRGIASAMRRSGTARKPHDQSGRRRILLGLLALGVAPGVARAADWWDQGADTLESLQGDGDSGLSQGKIARGLKEALRVASTEVVSRLGQAGGYLDDPEIHIPLPDYLQTARDGLETVGAAGLLNDLEQQINRAAEKAAPVAESIFFDAIAQMTVADARRILNGPPDAATRYFERTMSPELRTAFRPIVDERLSQTGAMRTLDWTVEQYESIPFGSSLVEDAEGRLVDHTLGGALDGLFHYMAREEAAIREDPAKRTTELLEDVFG